MGFSLVYTRFESYCWSMNSSKPHLWQSFWIQVIVEFYTVIGNLFATHRNGRCQKILSFAAHQMKDDGDTPTEGGRL